MQHKYAHLYSKISRQQFLYAMEDVEELRSKLRNVEDDLPRSFIQTMSRQRLTDALLTNQFGADPIIEYKAFCAESDKLEKFVNGEIEADQL